MLSPGGTGIVGERGQRCQIQVMTLGGRLGADVGDAALEIERELELCGDDVTRVDVEVFEEFVHRGLILCRRCRFNRRGGAERGHPSGEGIGVGLIGRRQFPQRGADVSDLGGVPLMQRLDHGRDAPKEFELVEALRQGRSLLSCSVFPDELTRGDDAPEDCDPGHKGECGKPSEEAGPREGVVGE